MTKEEIKEIICDVANIEKISDEEPLMTGGIIDSFSTLILISKLELKYNVEIVLEGINIDDIDSVNKIYTLLQNKRNES